MHFRPYNPDTDVKAVQRIWRECGWLSDDNIEAMKIVLESGRRVVAVEDGQPETLVTTLPGTLRYLRSDVPLGLVSGVATSRLVRRRGLAGRLTARCIAEDVADGAHVECLGIFEQGFYNRLGFGNGCYERMIEFDPARLRLPSGRRARIPRRLTADDWEIMHAGRLRARTCHGACRFPDPMITHFEVAASKGGFGLGYFDGPNGSLSHHFWCETGGSDEHGPYRIRWLAYRTRAELLELLSLIQSLGDQVHQVRMIEPPDLQLQDLIDRPLSTRRISREGAFGQQFWIIAWWQMRMNNVVACLGHTIGASGSEIRFNLDLSDPIENYFEDDATWRGVAGAYVVSIGGNSGAERGHDDSLPTLSASVNALTRLWLGVRPASSLAVTDDLTAPPDLLEALDWSLRLPEPHPDWEY